MLTKNLSKSIFLVNSFVKLFSEGYHWLVRGTEGRKPKNLALEPASTTPQRPLYGISKGDKVDRYQPKKP